MALVYFAYVYLIGRRYFTLTIHYGKALVCWKNMTEQLIVLSICFKFSICFPWNHRILVVPPRPCHSGNAEGCVTQHLDEMPSSLRCKRIAFDPRCCRNAWFLVCFWSEKGEVYNIHDVFHVSKRQPAGFSCWFRIRMNLVGFYVGLLD